LIQISCQLEQSMIHSSALLRLLQLASPTLPVGAYSYSEGLEHLVETGQVDGVDPLAHWLRQELRYGAVRLEGAIALRSYNATHQQDWNTLCAWNRWLSAARDTEELRLQSWQMGRSLLRLYLELEPEMGDRLPIATLQTEGCQFAVMVAIVAGQWQIPPEAMLLAYLHSWLSNLISAAIKLIPLGQTAGQQLLFRFQPDIEAASHIITRLTDDQLETCGWGLSLASMAHETQYSRLFRS
jgi:urease accessory protein